MTQRQTFKPYLDSPDRPTPFYRNLRSIIHAGLRLVGTATIRGRENIPDGPYILAANHRAHVDPPYLSMITPRQPSFMAKRELFEGFIGCFVRRLGGFPVRRGEADRAALRTAIDLLAKGYAVAIFPEGTRSPDRRLYPAEPGFGLIARQSGAPILPVAIEGTELILPKGSIFIRRHPVTITIGKPFTMADALQGQGVARRDELDAIGRITMERIRALMVDPVPIADVRPAN